MSNQKLVYFGTSFDFDLDKKQFIMETIVYKCTITNTKEGDFVCKLKLECKEDPSKTELDKKVYKYNSKIVVINIILTNQECYFRVCIDALNKYYELCELSNKDSLAYEIYTDKVLKCTLMLETLETKILTNLLLEKYNLYYYKIMNIIPPYKLNSVKYFKYKLFDNCYQNYDKIKIEVDTYNELYAHYNKNINLQNAISIYAAKSIFYYWFINKQYKNLDKKCNVKTISEQVARLYNIDMYKIIIKYLLSKNYEKIYNIISIGENIYS
jgi:hypothetical protein